MLKICVYFYIFWTFRRSFSNAILSHKQMVSPLNKNFELYFQLPSAIGEEPTFGYSEDILDSFFKPLGVSWTF